MGLMSIFRNERPSRYAPLSTSKGDEIGGINNSSACLTEIPVDFFNLPMNPAGYPVNEVTSMRVAAAYACVEKICVIAGLPKHIYKRANGGSERVDHDYWQLLNNEPSDNWTAASMWELIIKSFLLRGDGVCHIQRKTRSGTIVGIVPYVRENVQILRDVKGEVGYKFTDPYTKKQFTARKEDVLHIPGFGFNGYHGMSVIQYAASSGVGIALAADQYSAEFFANSARPDYLLTTDGVLNEKQRADTRAALEERHGGIGKRHKPLVLQGGLKIMPISLTADDAQLLQTREFEVVNICIAFGVPPQLIGAKESTAGWAGSSLEQLNLGFAKYTLKGHIIRCEQEINRKLFKNSDYFVKFNMDSFLEGDSKTQSEVFGKAAGGPGQQGWMAVNEIRKLKNLPPDPNPKFDRVLESGALASASTTPAGT